MPINFSTYQNENHLVQSSKIQQAAVKASTPPHFAHLQIFFKHSPPLSSLQLRDQLPFLLSAASVDHKAFSRVCKQCFEICNGL